MKYYEEALAAARLKRQTGRGHAAGGMGAEVTAEAGDRRGIGAGHGAEKKSSSQRKYLLIDGSLNRTHFEHFLELQELPKVQAAIDSLPLSGRVFASCNAHGTPRITDRFCEAILAYVWVSDRVPTFQSLLANFRESLWFFWSANFEGCLRVYVCVCVVWCCVVCVCVLCVCVLCVLCVCVLCVCVCVVCVCVCVLCVCVCCVCVGCVCVCVLCVCCVCCVCVCVCCVCVLCVCVLCVCVCVVCVCCVFVCCVCVCVVCVVCCVCVVCVCVLCVCVCCVCSVLCCVVLCVSQCVCVCVCVVCVCVLCVCVLCVCCVCVCCVCVLCVWVCCVCSVLCCVVLCVSQCVCVCVYVLCVCAQRTQTQKGFHQLTPKKNSVSSLFENSTLETVFRPFPSVCVCVCVCFRENQTCTELRATVSRHLLPPVSQWVKTVDS